MAKLLTKSDTKHTKLLRIILIVLIITSSVVSLYFLNKTFEFIPGNDVRAIAQQLRAAGAKEDCRREEGNTWSLSGPSNIGIYYTAEVPAEQVNAQLRQKVPRSFTLEENINATSTSHSPAYSFYYTKQGTDKRFLLEIYRGDSIVNPVCNIYPSEEAAHPTPDPNYYDPNKTRLYLRSD